jgi:hypothetical protein
MFRQYAAAQAVNVGRDERRIWDVLFKTSPSKSDVVHYVRTNGALRFAHHRKSAPDSRAPHKVQSAHMLLRGATRSEGDMEDNDAAEEPQGRARDDAQFWVRGGPRADHSRRGVDHNDLAALLGQRVAGKASGQDRKRQATATTATASTSKTRSQRRPSFARVPCRSFGSGVVI